ncbi:hypothetical protein MTR67_030571 [Solanum verrucosum]|uniref:DUF4283 domain-containing protein n=1 Tax=Solanum verrucosum TaxID=315347 RepID=A0AAF0R7V5_SOLVR|nr:hypothetical protein MTR67_030571 [Solanum verrucosum]
MWGALNGTQMAVWRLQFSESSTLARPTLGEKTDYEDNRNVKQVNTLSYIPPSSKDGNIYVTIEQDDLKEQEIYWKSALTRYVTGDTPYLKTMENFIMNAWKFVKKPQLLMHEEGYYIFRFETVEDCERVMQAGPYTFFNKPFVLQNWSIDFEFNPDCITTIPLWIMLPGLPVGYWSRRL